MACKSLFISTTNGLYSSKNPLIGNNIEIHLVFTWCNILFPFVSNNSTSLHCSKYLLGEEEKQVYVECKSLSIFCIRGCFENVCTIKLIMCAAQWTINIKRIALWELVWSHHYKHQWKQQHHLTQNISICWFLSRLNHHKPIRNWRSHWSSC